MEKDDVTWIILKAHSRYKDYEWREFRKDLKDAVDYIKDFDVKEVSYKMVNPDLAEIKISWYDSSHFSFTKIKDDLNRMFLQVKFDNFQ